MAAPSTKAPKSAPGKQRPTGDVVHELWMLTRDYAKQETVDPLKAIGNFLAKGIPGAVLLGLGGFFIGLGILRLLQEETGSSLTGSWDWVPYLVTFVVLVLAIALLVSAIKRAGRSKAATPEKTSASITSGPRPETVTAPPTPATTTATPPTTPAATSPTSSSAGATQTPTARPAPEAAPPGEAP